MKKIIVPAMCVVIVGQLLAQSQQVNEYLGRREAALKKYSEYSANFQAFTELHKEDPEIILGIAYLYETYGVPRPQIPTKPIRQGEYRSIEESIVDPVEMAKEAETIPDLYKVVLALEPQDKAAWAGLARILSRYFTGMRRMWLEELEAHVAYAQKMNMDVINIRRDSILYPLLKEFGYLPMDKVVKSVHERVEQKTRSVLETLRQGQEVDPENALYNYLIAHVYFSLGDTESGLAELEGVAEKPYWNNYTIEAGRARSRVLRESGFPEDNATMLAGYHRLYADFLMTAIWSKLRSIEEVCDSSGDLATAIRVNKIMKAIAKHIKEEPKPHESLPSKQRAESLENHVKEREKVLSGESNKKR